MSADREAHSHAEAAARRDSPDDKGAWLKRMEEKHGPTPVSGVRSSQQLRGELPVRRLVADEQEAADTDAADAWIKEHGGW
jgi:hypothetical protein